MTNKLQNEISRAENLAKNGQNKSAIMLATKLLEEYPDEMEVWRLRAYLYGRDENYSNATSDLTRAIEINSQEPVLFFDRGRYSLAENDYSSAVDDFNKGLDLCDRYQNDYYREAFHFLRAEAYIALGKKQDALADLAFVNDEYELWINELRAKKDLIAECRTSH